MSQSSVVAAIEHFRARLTPTGQQRYIELRDWIAAEASRGDDLLSTNYELVRHLARHHAAPAHQEELARLLLAMPPAAPDSGTTLPVDTAPSSTRRRRSPTRGSARARRCVARL